MEITRHVRRPSRGRRKPATAGVAAIVCARYGEVEPVPHVICAGVTREETEERLVELSYISVQNVLAVRGDGATASVPLDFAAVLAFCVLMVFVASLGPRKILE